MKKNRSFRIWSKYDCPRYNQMPWAFQITEIDPFVCAFIRVTIWYKYQGFDQNSWHSPGLKGFKICTNRVSSTLPAHQFRGLALRNSDRRVPFIFSFKRDKNSQASQYFSGQFKQIYDLSDTKKIVQMIHFMWQKGSNTELNFKILF